MAEFIGQIVLGLFETVLGRRLFWLFAMIGGFLIGWYFLDAVSGLGWAGRFTIGIILAIVLAVVAHKRLKVAIAIAGFFIFGAVAVKWFEFLGVDVSKGKGAWWAVFVVAGVVAAALLTYAFDKALIALSSLTGGGATATRHRQLRERAQVDVRRDRGRARDRRRALPGEGHEEAWGPADRDPQGEAGGREGQSLTLSV